MLVAALLTSSCDKSSDNVSSITTYHEISILGDEVVLHPVNTPYEDAGCISMQGDEDVTAGVVVSNPVDVNTTGVYTIVYKSTNSDGFSASASRTVKVYDPAGTLQGDWSSSINRAYNGATASRSRTVSLLALSSNRYLVECLLGGWYSGNGASYLAKSIITVNDDNTLTLNNCVALPWGYPCTFVEGSAKYDPATDSFTWTSYMLDVPTMLFNVTLTR